MEDYLKYFQGNLTHKIKNNIKLSLITSRKSKEEWKCEHKRFIQWSWKTTAEAEGSTKRWKPVQSFGHNFFRCVQPYSDSNLHHRHLQAPGSREGMFNQGRAIWEWNPQSGSCPLFGIDSRMHLLGQGKRGSIFFSLQNVNEKRLYNLGKRTGYHRTSRCKNVPGGSC